MHAALMAGGQLTKRMLTKHVKLEPGKGTSTFDYQANSSVLGIEFCSCRDLQFDSSSYLQEPVQPLRNEYKRIINSLPEVLTEQQVEEVHFSCVPYTIHSPYMRF